MIELIVYIVVGVSNGSIQFESAHKIWPLLQLLAKIRWVLASSCSQNFCNCWHAQSDFRLNSLPCSVSIICILQTKTDTGNNVSGMENWETLEKHARAMNVSGKMLPRFVDVYCLFICLLISSARVHSQGAGQPCLKHFACEDGLSLTFLRGNLLACKQGLRKLQTPFSVKPLILVKLSEVIFLQQTAY